MFDIQDYHYELPEELIAQVPAQDRDGSRLFLVDRREGSFANHQFSDLPRLLRPGDLLVVNNTRVVPARLLGRKQSGGAIEVLVLEHADAHTSPDCPSRWCMYRASKRPKKGSILLFGGDLSGMVEGFDSNGLIRICFRGPPVDAFMSERGRLPLPPYIDRAEGDRRSRMDGERYQTVFSRQSGAIAAPTAGLHFSRGLIESLVRAGVEWAEITLHVGLGTFQPVRSRDIRDHTLGEESYSVPASTAHAVNTARRGGRRIIAVGTTVVRTLESVARMDGVIDSGSGRTGLLITPGYHFKVIDGMITNFHLPRSSLLFLVSAFAGLELVREAYRRAIEERYRFYSYGDAMLIL